jgi:protein disulfide-isomerase
MSIRQATLTAWALLLAAGLATAQEGVRWAGDYREAAEQAARERKLVLLHFESDSCPPCRKLEANVFPRRDVAEAVEAGYVAVKVNVDKTPELARRYTVPRWPMDVVVTPMGQEVYRQISPQDPAEYIARLKETSARSGSAAKPQATNTTQPVGYQTRGSFGKKPAPDQSAELESLVIENGAPTTPADKDRIEPQPVVPQQNEYVAKPQTSPYSPQPASEKRAVTPPSTSDSGTEYEGIDPVSPRAVAKSAAPNNQEASKPAHESGAAAPVAQSKAPILPPIGMEGYCVVTLHAYNQKVAEAQAAGVSLDPTIQGWVKGNKKFGAIHRGRLYLFASTDAQKAFLADPDRYAPALSGYDPVVFNDTQKLVDGKRSIGLCYNGQVYVFASEASLQKFMTSPKPFADTVYQAMLRSDQAKIR